MEEGEYKKMRRIWKFKPKSQAINLVLCIWTLFFGSVSKKVTTFKSSHPRDCQSGLNQTNEELIKASKEKCGPSENRS